MVYKHIENYYEHFHKLGIFDWWKLSEIEKGLLVIEDRRAQSDLERELNYIVRDMLRVLNRFDFSKVDKDILKDLYQRYLPKDERKRLGEFYTPDEVITYILDAVGYTSNNDVETKFLLDPACGSGSFLVEALRRLIQRYERKGFNLKDPVIAKSVLDDVVDRIYGLDINPFACFIAEMNILFQVVDLYEVVKRKYSEYRLRRFKIFQTDSLAPPLTKEQKEMMELELIKTTNSRAKSFIEENMMADLVKGMLFDFVVGNPPYVRKERITTDYKEIVLKSAYPEVYHGDNDICVYFIAKGIKWLREEGQFGYIVSGKFTKTRYGRRIREYVPDTCRLLEFLDFRGVKIFVEATNDPCILILKKEPIVSKRDSNIIKMIKVQKEMTSPRKLIEHISGIQLEQYSDEYINLFTINQKTLDGSSWKLIPSTVYDVFNKIKQNSSKSLKEICEKKKVTRGVQTGFNDAFLVKKQEIGKYQLESELLKPCLRGEDVKRYEINYDGWYLIYPRNVIIDKYPKIHDFIIQFKDRLEKRWCVRDPRMGRKWYELEKPKDPNLFESEKIICPDISIKNNFTYEKGDYYCIHTCYIIPIKNDYKKLIKYILGVLNSKTLEFYFKQIGSYLGKKGFRYQTQYLKNLPIKLPKSSKEMKKVNEIINFVNKILQYNKERNVMEQKIKAFPDCYLQKKGEKLWIIAKSAPTKFSKGIYRFSKKDLEIETVREITGEDSYRLKIAKKEYFTFRTFNEARYVQKLLRKRGKVTKSELIALEIPTKGNLDKIMRQYDQDVNKIEEIKDTVKKLEDEIDELVYQLYGLDSEDKKVIEEYLTKF